MLNIRNSKGITLIALVITIIILLILAGISISAIFGENGLIERANNTKIEQRGASVEEQRDLWIAEQQMVDYAEGEVRNLKTVIGELKSRGLLTEYEENRILKIDGKVEIGSRSGDKAIVFKELTIADYFDETGTDPDKLKVGDKVNYSPSGDSKTYTLEDPAYASSEASPSPLTMTRNSSTNNLGWRVLDIKDGQVRLISENSTDSYVTFHGANGYNNAVKILDDLCSELYNNSNLASNVQNLKIEDIEEKLTSTALNTVHAPPYETYPYSALPKGRVYPKIWASEIGATINGSLQSGTLRIKRTGSRICNRGISFWGNITNNISYKLD